MELSEVKLGQHSTAVIRTVAAPVRVIAIAGGKGGSGKTSVAVNLAWSLAGLGQHTLLLDADLGMANVDVLLGLETRHTLLDVMYRQFRLEEIMLRTAADWEIAAERFDLNRGLTDEQSIRDQFEQARLFKIRRPR